MRGSSSPPWTPPPPPPLYDEVERATQAILVHGRLAGLWVGIATILTLRIRQAAPLAHLLLAIAVACLVAGTMPLKQSPLADARSFMERLPGILLMVGVALVASGFTTASPAREPPPPPPPARRATRAATA